MTLIPAGIFQMGNPNQPRNSDNFLHTVEIDSFYMDKYEVTVGQYKQFIEETGYEFTMSLWEKYFISPTDNHPVVSINWIDATAYAKWAGKRLPTEAEWEYASRGGLENKLFPWGNELTHNDANYHRTWDKNITFDYPNYFTTGKIDIWRYSTAPVGSFSPNGYGLYDMAGNVGEWCQDWYQFDYYLQSPKKNPQGPNDGKTKVIRGGHWFSWDKGLRVYNRGGLPVNVKYWQNVQGFRCVKDID